MGDKMSDKIVDIRDLRRAAAQARLNAAAEVLSAKELARRMLEKSGQGEKP